MSLNNDNEINMDTGDNQIYETPFQQDKRTQSDDANLRHFSNGDNANNGQAMIKLVHDCDENGCQESLTDALTNLRHWAHRENVDFDAAVASSLTHWEAEK